MRKSSYGSSALLATLFSYLDRGAAFLLPIVVLKVLNEPAAYISIEYIISLSIILATFFDAGLRSYLLFYSQKVDSVDSAIYTTVGSFKILFVFHVIAISLCAIFSSFDLSDPAFLIAIAISRASGLSIVGLLMQALILIGKPAYSAIPSLVTWIIGALAFLSPLAQSHASVVFLFFSGSYAAMVFLLFLYFFKGKAFDFKSSYLHLKENFLWGWPLLFAAAASMIVANFSKIYAFSHFQQDEIVNFSFWMRIFSIVQLSHVAIVSLLVMDIYRSKSGDVLLGNLSYYAKLIMVPAIGVMIFWGLSISYFPSIPALNLMATNLLLLYFVLWCFGAYLEIYLTKRSRNALVLKFSLLSSLVYSGALIFTRPSSSSELALIMMSSAFIYTSLMLMANFYFREAHKA